MKISRILQAYYDGAKAAREKKPSNVPPRLTKDQKKAWQNGYRDNR